MAWEAGRGTVRPDSGIKYRYFAPGRCFAVNSGKCWPYLAGFASYKAEMPPIRPLFTAISLVVRDLGENSGKIYRYGSTGARNKLGKP
ncbi:hypothetical protein D3C76_1396750 [compost metagenome]